MVFCGGRWKTKGLSQSNKINQKRLRMGEVYVKIDIKWENFEIKRGVKQKDPLSPTLFNCVLEEAMQQLDWEGRGAKNRRTTSLTFILQTM